MSSTGGFEAYLQSRNGATSAELAQQAQKLMMAAAKRPELAGVQTTFSANVPQLNVQLDRDKAKSLGVAVGDVFDAMSSTFGSLYVNDFSKFGRIFTVQLQSEADFRDSVEDLRNVFVRGQNGQMIPLTSLVTIEQRTGPEVVDRYNAFPAAKFVGGPAPGYSSGESLAAMEQLAKEVLPDGYTLAWTGSAFQEKSTGGSSSMVFVVALLMVFLILSAQYERWTLPFAVLTAVPFAVFGALLARVLPGRAGHADRSGGQKRHPDRGVCRDQDGRRHEPGRRRHRRRQAALPPYRDDLAGLYSGLRTAGYFQRCRLGQPPRHRYRRDWRHVGRDLYCGAVHPAVLQADHAAVARQGRQTRRKT